MDTSRSLNDVFDQLVLSSSKAKPPEKKIESVTGLLVPELLQSKSSSSFSNDTIDWLERQLAFRDAVLSCYGSILLSLSVESSASFPDLLKFDDSFSWLKKLYEDDAKEAESMRREGAILPSLQRRDPLTDPAFFKITPEMIPRTTSEEAPSSLEQLLEQSRSRHGTPSRPVESPNLEDLLSQTSSSSTSSDDYSLREYDTTDALYMKCIARIQQLQEQTERIKDKLASVQSNAETESKIKRVEQLNSDYSKLIKDTFKTSSERSIGDLESLTPTEKAKITVPAYEDVEIERNRLASAVQVMNPDVPSWEQDQTDRQSGDLPKSNDTVSYIDLKFQVDENKVKWKDVMKLALKGFFLVLEQSIRSAFRVFLGFDPQDVIFHKGSVSASIIIPVPTLLGDGLKSALDWLQNKFGVPVTMDGPKKAIAGDL